jgi:hypothetical protein
LQVTEAKRGSKEVGEEKGKRKKSCVEREKEDKRKHDEEPKQKVESCYTGPVQVGKIDLVSKSPATKRR